jgi:hypothetical protein
VLAETAQWALNRLLNWHKAIDDADLLRVL